MHPGGISRDGHYDTARRSKTKTAWMMASAGWVLVGVLHVVAPRLPVLMGVSVGALAVLEIVALAGQAPLRIPSDTTGE